MKGFLLTVLKTLRSICSLTVIMERCIQWLYVFSGLDSFFPFLSCEWRWKNHL